MELSTTQAIEVFHLVFMARLAQIVDKGLFALKGGCNLRFYFQSIRYSEDIDFDIRTMAPTTLKKNVDQILKSTSLAAALRSKNIEIVSVSAPKQTETTQRWKVAIRVIGSALSVPTKIEFSRRDDIIGAEVAAVDAELVSSYSLLPLLINHYPVNLAIEQKIRALIGRTETQARDIFDLDLLMSKSKHFSARFTKDELNTAIENAMSVSLDQFRAQVVAYLKDEFRDHYSNETQWTTLQSRVIDRIEKLR